MSLLEPAGANYIGVQDIGAATYWYSEKLGLRKVNVELDDGEDCVALGFAKDECAVCLGPVGRSSGELTAMLYSSNVKKARECLVSRGVNASELQEDRQGTRFFVIRDLEGNEIEITESP